MLFKLAWRNIWRNKRRTSITLASLFFAVVLSSLMMSIKHGVYKNMTNSMIGTFTGYAQIHQNGYWEDKSINNSFELTNDLINKVSKHPNINGYLPRIESYALVSADEITKGVMVVGVDPELEDKYSGMGERIKTGSFFKKNSRSVLLGSGLAKYLKIDAGDTLVLLGQGYHGASAAGKYPVEGIVNYGSPEMSKQIVFMPLKEAQWYLNARNICTAIVLKLDDNDLALQTSRELQATVGEEYEVMDWNTMVPELQKMIEGDKVEGYIFMFIMYMVISFGMFGTVLMMLAERRREFGVLIALGMKKINLGIMVWMEIIFMALLGTLIGIMGAFPLAGYFYINPIKFGEELSSMYEDYGMEAVIQSSLEPSIFINQGIIVFIVASVIALYPIFKLIRTRAIDAMRN